MAGFSGLRYLNGWRRLFRIPRLWMDKMAIDHEDPPLPREKPGVGVDFYGGGVVDPTENVKALVEAKAQSDAMLRDADKRFLDANLVYIEKLGTLARSHDKLFGDYAREAEAKIALIRSEGETRRIDQLAETRQEFQNTIRDMLAESVRTTSTLVSDQLKQIQATFDNRVSKLEAGAFTQAGKQSERDPAIEGAIQRLTMSMATMSQVNTDTLNKMAQANNDAVSKLATLVSAIQQKADTSGGKEEGKQESFSSGWLIFGAIVAGLASMASVITLIVHLTAGK